MENVIPFNREEYVIIKEKKKLNEKNIQFNLKHFIIGSSFLSLIIMTLFSALAVSINAQHSQQIIISNLKNQIENEKITYTEQINQLTKKINTIRNCDDDSNKQDIKSVLAPSPFLIHEFAFNPIKGDLINTINQIISKNYSKVKLVFDGAKKGNEYLSKIDHNSIVVITLKDGRQFALCPKSDIRKLIFVRGEVYEIKNRRVFQLNVSIKLKPGFLYHSQSYIKNANQEKEYFQVKDIKIYKNKV